jgi:tetratricopeptide (TPR) repeat protein
LEPPARSFDHPLAGYPVELAADERQTFEAAWQAFEVGDQRAARDGFAALLKRHPQEPAVLVALAAAELGGHQNQLAAGHAAEAVRLDPNYPQAALLAARAAAAAGAEADAVHFYEQASRLYPDRGEITAEAESYRSGATEAALARARAARQRGDRAGELAALEQACELARQSPRPFIELGEAWLRHGDPSRAAAAFERAARVGGDNPQLFQRIESLLRELGRPAEAEEWRRRAAGGAPVPAPEPVSRALEALIQKPQLTRGELAELLVGRSALVEKLAPLARPPVLTDLGGSGAEQASLWVAALGLIEPRPNHTFAPASLLKRGQLAVALDRLLDLYVGHGARLPDAPAAPPIADVLPGHRQATSIRRCIALGLLELDSMGSFHSSSSVSGEEVWQALERLLRLVRAD